MVNKQQELKLRSNEIVFKMLYHILSLFKNYILDNYIFLIASNKLKYAGMNGTQ
jgi:hypothetical protein